MIKETGHENMYFPLFIPESFLRNEQEHVEGFAPQVAWVTKGGDKDLEERLAVRPTSEAIIGPIVRKYIRSYRDLPLLLNQWANVVRWELRTRLFLRTMEFLWQEGHTFHATYQEAAEEAKRMLDVYNSLMRDYLAIHAIAGTKPSTEKFAGADYTLSLEAMMSDGLALQACTSHNLGRNFTKAYGIEFTDQNNQRQNPFSTSWGLSTRIIGAIIMVHGDNLGLVLPPKVAPVQVVIIPIYKDEHAKSIVLEKVLKVESALKSLFRVKVDLRDDVTPGYKFSEWDLKGVPLRIEIGPKDVAQDSVTLVRRVDRQKQQLPLMKLEQVIKSELDEVHNIMLSRSRKQLESSSCDVSTLDELKHIFEKNNVFAYAGWCEHIECEKSIKDTVKGISPRVFPFSLSEKVQACIVCGRPGRTVLLAKAY